MYIYIYICVPSPRFSRKIDRITAYAPASVAAYKNRNKKKGRLDRALHARTERRENAMLGKKGWKPGSVLQKIARSNESFLLIELITTPSPISFPHIFERNVGNGAARCAVNQHRSANRIESRAKLVIDHRFFPFSFSFFEELQQGKRLSRLCRGSTVSSVSIN